MYHEINSNLQNFVCQLKKTFLNIVWGLPSGTENALRKEISTAALLDQRLWTAAARSRGASSPPPPRCWRTLLKASAEKPLKGTLRE